MSDRKATTVYFVVDATSSMTRYLRSLKPTLKQILVMLRVLVDRDTNIRVVAYRDYCDGDRKLENSRGGCTDEELFEFVDDLRPMGGGDWPEALKSGLHHVLSCIEKDRDANSLVILYTDAPPHTNLNYDAKDSGGNAFREKKALEKSHSEAGGFDWVGICSAFRERNVDVYCVLSTGTRELCHRVYPLLGDCLWFRGNPSSDSITKVTAQLFSKLLGETDHADDGGDVHGDGVDFSPRVSPDGFEREEEVTCSFYRPQEKVKWSPSKIRLDPLPWLLPSSPSCKGEGIEKLLVERWKSEDGFQDLVFRSLTSLLSERQGILAILENPVVGKLWRLCCRNRLDERLPPLRDVFRKTTESLDRATRDNLKEWIETSYDYSTDYASLVNGLDPKERPLLPCLVLDPAACRDLLPDRGELRSIGKFDVVEKILGLPRHLMVLRDGDIDEALLRSRFNKDDVPLFLPLSLPKKEIFAWMPHLINRGQWYSARPAAVMALLCKLGGIKALVKPADEWLRSLKGTGWLGLEQVERFPEVVSPDYLTLMAGRLSANDKERYLSKWEAQAFDRLYAMYKLWFAACNDALTLKITTGFLPSGERYEVRPDYLRKCISCGHDRSFTLMTEHRQNVCGVCCWAREEVCKGAKAEGHKASCCKSKVLFEAEDLDSFAHCADCSKIVNRGSVSVPSTAGSSKSNCGRNSHLVECRTCAALYALVHVDRLHVAPKCYYCRSGKKAPTITCTGCLNKYVCPDGDPGVKISVYETASKGKAFVCGTCAFDKVRRLMVWDDVSVKDLLSEPFGAQFAATAANLPLSATKVLVETFVRSKGIISDRHMAYKIMTSRKLRNDVVESCGGDRASMLNGGVYTFKRKIVHDLAMLQHELRTKVFALGDDGLLRACNMCFQPKQSRTLHKVCGSCEAVACAQCLGKWYRDPLQPGRMPLPLSHLSCPFCRLPTAKKRIKNVNPQALMILDAASHLTKTGGGDLSRKYGWCKSCFEIKQVGREDGGEGCCITEWEEVEENSFVCEDCGSKPGLLGEHKVCPGCAAPTFRVSGCPHMQCSRCAEHWCWLCAEGFGKATDASVSNADIAARVYVHIDEVHRAGGDAELNEEEGDY